MILVVMSDQVSKWTLEYWNGPDGGRTGDRGGGSDTASHPDFSGLPITWNKRCFSC